jgi:hypothetical protein
MLADQKHKKRGLYYVVFLMILNCPNTVHSFHVNLKKHRTIFFRLQPLLQEFMVAIDVTSSGTPREKLMWAFR